MKAEVTCTNNDCETVVELLPHGGRTWVEHHRARWLLDNAPRAAHCHHCGAEVKIERLVPDAHRFALGDLHATAGIARALAAAEDQEKVRPLVLMAALAPLIEKHVTGQWGDLDEEDRQVNERAVEGGERILSRYEHEGRPIYVITEADRVSTTVLFADEY